MAELKDSAAPWWQAFVDAIDKLPLPRRASALARLALILAARRERNTARVLALGAWRQAREAGTSKTDPVIRRALLKVTPGYHVQISTDVERITAWETVFAEVIRPGMLALEIGAGSGILAMLAARAGATVVSCEKNPILAAIAEETVRRNGLGERIRIIDKPAELLRVPEDLPRQADLLFLDLFGDRLFDFKPFDIVRQARRLIRPDATTIPQRVSLEGALANFRQWHRIVPTPEAKFELSSLTPIAPMQIALDTAERDLCLRSSARTMISVTLPHDLPEDSGTTEHVLVSDGGPVNGVTIWLRLELAGGCVLEAKPSSAPHGFYAHPTFFAFDEAFETSPGQACSIRFHWEDQSINVGLVSGVAEA